MRYNTYYESTAFGIGGSLTRSIKFLIIGCTASFIVGKLFELSGSSFWLDAFGLTPVLVRKYLLLWQLGTYMFVHGNIWHLIFNMFVLWMFGGELERVWGSREFLVFFFITGVCVGLLYFIFASGLPLIVSAGSPYQVLIGSSGAIFGLLAAYGLMFPERTVLFMLLFPMKAKWFVLLIAAIEFYMSWSPSGVSHFAHLSGLLIGYLYLKKEWNLTRLADYYHDRKRRKRVRLVALENEIERQEKDEIDRILDKINAQGMKSLSRNELKILERASEKRKNK